ncbi:MAG: lipid asymmetry maintenance protein MlaB [Comamonas sp.]
MASVIALPAVLNEAQVLQVQQQLQPQMRAVPAGTDIVLDAAAVQSFDSAGLALLLALRRQAEAQACTLHVRAWPQQLQSLAQVYGVLPLLHPDAAAAGAAASISL